MDPEDPEWLSETFSGLYEERKVLLEMIDHMKLYSAEALVEAELGVHEVVQEMSVMQALLRRIGVIAGDHFVDYLMELVRGGEGDTSEESEEEEIADDDELGEIDMPLFGDAELPYDPEQMAELMAYVRPLTVLSVAFSLTISV